MTRDELLARLTGLRRARVGQIRVPHKPLLLLWLFGQFAATGSSVAICQQARGAGQPDDQRLQPARGQPGLGPPASDHTVCPPGNASSGISETPPGRRSSGCTRTSRLASGPRRDRPPAAWQRTAMPFVH
jgi:hypothetical protein